MPSSSECSLGLFPYPGLRKGQQTFISDIQRTLDQGGGAILEAGTGMGKTVCALAPALDKALENNKRILYLTRTNSQQRQVIAEFKAMPANAWPKEKIACLPLQGRRHMCPMAWEDREFSDASSEELAKICRKLRGETVKVVKGGKAKGPICGYFKKTLKAGGEGQEEFEAYFREKLPTAEEAVNYLHQRGVCPHEVLKKLLPKALTITAPYIYFFDPGIRQALLHWANLNLENTILVVDEAHNLPDFARDLGSAELGMVSLERGESEVDEAGVDTSHDLSIRGVFETIGEIIFDIRDEYLLEEDGFVPRDSLYVELMSALGITSRTLDDMLTDLLRIGEEIKEKRLKANRLPRSYIHSAAGFLKLWTMASEGTHALLVRSQGKADTNPHLEIFCIDPGPITGVVNEVGASVHMSGTLRPLEEYRDSVGIEKVVAMESLPSPFPGENREVLYNDEVTTRYEALQTREEEMLGKIRDKLTEVMDAGGGRNTMVFFPSYTLYQKVTEGLDEALRGREIFSDERGMSQARIMNMIGEFGRSNGGVALSVLGGRLSEGMDLPGKALELVVIIGIPYPKPTARQRALENYYDIKFGKGWDYGVKAPATRRMLQAIGRLIRGERDRGCAVILDSRAGNFGQEIQGLRSSSNLGAEIRNFFSK